MRLSCFGQITSVAGSAMLLVLPIAGTRAQGITVDGRLSPAQTLMGPNYAIGANLGRQVGGNLFHSFGAFGLNQSETATFSGPASVANVIGRVTGGAQSAIDGTVRSTMPGANLYLINPAGVVFGPNARVDVSGSFHASSADYLRLQDGARFQATNPDASTLSAAPPAAFGFLTPNPRPVTVNNGATLGTGKGGTLGLVGGPVTIRGGVLQAPAGTVHLTSAAGVGEVPVNPRSGSGPTMAAFGPVRVEGKSKIAVSDAAGLGSGGSVFIRAGTLDVTASEIDADNHGPGPGGMVSLRGDGAVTISDGANVHALALGVGRGADISIGAGSALSVMADAVIQAGTSGASPSGDVSVTAAGTLTILNGGAISASTSGTGKGGMVRVQADSIMQDAGYISSNTKGMGRGGDVSVTAMGSLTILNGNISGATSGAGDGGQVTVQAGSLAISRNGQITAGTSASGTAGSVAVTVPGAIDIDGSGATTGSETGIASRAFRESMGNAGTVRVEAGKLAIRGGGVISGDTSGTGKGGMVTVQADSVMQDAGFISSTTSGANPGGDVSVTAAGTLTILNGGAISASTSGTGKGGMVRVQADSIMQDAGYISSNTKGMGRGGDVSVTAMGSLTILNGNISGATSGAGDGGQVTVQAGSLAISRNGQITAGTSASGTAGSVAVTVPGAIDIDGSGATTGSETGIASRAFRESMGNAGTVRVEAGKLAIRGGGVISGDTSGTGKGGMVTVQADSVMQDAGFISSTTSGANPGGDVSVTAAGTLTILNGGAISASTSGTGKGGMVRVQADSIMQDAGYISSNTKGMGRGGDVSVTATGSLTILNGNISGATSGAGDGGQVTVQAGSLAISRNGQITAGTSASGTAGSVAVTVPGAIDIDGSGATTGSETGIASRAFRESMGNAGTVRVEAGKLAIHGGSGNSSGIATDTHGAGDAGTVDVTVTSGALTIDGPGIETGIASRALTGSTGNAGTVTIRVEAGNLTIDGATSGISTTASTGQGGPITISAPRLILRNGAGISTAAEVGSGGNIIIGPGDLLYLQRSSITTFAQDASSGGTISFPGLRFVVLDRSSQITTQAGPKADIDFKTAQLVQSPDSKIRATGSILSADPPLNPTGALVVLTSELRAAAAVLQENCAAQGARPRSSLAAAGRGGLRQDPETTLPALYFANRPVHAGQDPAPEAPTPPLHTSITLSTRCG